MHLTNNPLTLGQAPCLDDANQQLALDIQALLECGLAQSGV